MYGDGTNSGTNGTNGKTSAAASGDGRGSGFVVPEVEFFSIADFARVVRQRLWIVVLVALLAASAAVAASLLSPPGYQASATVVVSPARPANAQDNLSNQVSGLQALTREMAVTGLNPSMGEEVARAQADPPSASELRDNLTIAQVEDTRFLAVSYTSSSREQARAVANAAAEVLAKEAPAASGMEDVAVAKVSAYAREPAALEGPNPVRNGVLAAVLGLLLGAGLAFLLERFWGGWNSPEELERALGVPNFAAVPDFGRARRGGRGPAAIQS